MPIHFCHMVKKRHFIMNQKKYFYDLIFIFILGFQLKQNIFLCDLSLPFNFCFPLRAFRHIVRSARHLVFRSIRHFPGFFRHFVSDDATSFMKKTLIVRGKKIYWSVHIKSFKKCQIYISSEKLIIHIFINYLKHAYCLA